MTWPGGCLAENGPLKNTVDLVGGGGHLALYFPDYCYLLRKEKAATLYVIELCYTLQ